MLWILGLVSWFLTSEAWGPGSETGDVAFRNVTVIDGTGVEAKSGMTVVVTGERISAVAPSDRVRLSSRTTVVEGRGKFLIPGLWDMHIHWYAKPYLTLFIVNGVTGVRHMFGAPLHEGWRKEIEKGELTGPRMVVSSPIVDGPDPVWPMSIAVSNEEEGRQTVVDLKNAGTDFVKVYSLLPRKAYFAIAKEAKAQGIPFAGHVPNSVKASEASDAGQRSIEHLTGVLLECSTREDELRGKPRRVRIPALLESFSSKRAEALFARFQRNKTWHCPTLVVLRSLAFLDDEEFRADPRLKHMPAGLTFQWDPKRDFRLKTRTAEDFRIARRSFQKALELVRAMKKAGVRIIAGTDTLNPYCFPGFSLHDELALLVEAGLTPMEAIQSATRDAAEYLDRLDSLGTVEKGKFADLVLLDANPLEDIRNTRKIAAVVKNGQLFTKTELREMLESTDALHR